MVVKKEKEIGKVTHWYDKIGVAVVKLSGTLSVGDKVKIRKGEVQLSEIIEQAEIDIKDLDKLYEKSNLPDIVDRKFINVV